MYNKESLRNFIENEFDLSTLKAFDKIKPYAYKADLGRYCILYIYASQYMTSKKDWCVSMYSRNQSCKSFIILNMYVLLVSLHFKFVNLYQHEIEI